MSFYSCIQVCFNVIMMLFEMSTPLNNDFKTDYAANVSLTLSHLANVVVCQYSLFKS